MKKTSTILLLFCGIANSVFAQQQGVSTINLKVSNVCENYGQIVGCNSPAGSGASQSLGNGGCPWMSVYMHEDSVGLISTIKYMTIDPKSTFNSSPKYLSLGDENRVLVYTSEVFPQNICNATITPVDTVVLDSIVACQTFNDNLYIIRNSTQPANLQIFVPPFQTAITFNLTLKPQLLELTYGFAAIIGEGPNGETKVNVLDLATGFIVRDTVLSPLASNPKSLNIQFPGMYLASSPGDSVITITEFANNYIPIGTTVVHAASGLNTGDFEYGFYHFQPLTDPTGNNNDKKVYRYELSSMSLYATFDINRRLHKLIYAGAEFYFFMHAVEQSAGNNEVFVYDAFNYQPADSFITSHQVDFVMADFRCFVGTPEYDDQLVNIKVFPNPSRGSVTINASGLICGRDYQMDIIDNNGKVVYEKTIHAKLNVEIPLDGLPSGSYYLRIHTRQGIKSQKIIRS